MRLKDYLEKKYLRMDDPSGANLDGLVLEMTKVNHKEHPLLAKNLKINLEEDWYNIITSDEFHTTGRTYRYENPFMVDGDGMIIEPASVILEDDMLFTGRNYIYDISIVPGKRNPLLKHSPVVNNCCITETFYDSDSYEPYKEIVMRFNPKHPANQGSNFKRRMLSLLGEIIDYPEMYQRSTPQSFSVRGYFERVERKGMTGKENELVLEMDLSKVSNPWISQNDYCLIFYFENSQLNDYNMNSTIQLNKFYLPSSMKEQFQEEVNQFNSRIEKRDLTNFIIRNGRQDLFEFNEKIIRPI